MRYSKQILTLAEQIEVLKQRGLIIGDESEAMRLCCIAYLLNIIDPQNTFVADFKTLLRKYPTVDPRAMGCPTDWEQEPLWRQEVTTSEHSHWLCRLFKFLGGKVTKKQA